MNGGLVLLDETQQRELYASGSRLTTPQPHRHTQSTVSSDGRSVVRGRGSLVSLQSQGSEPRTDFRSAAPPASPRTDFTTTGPRTDFRSAAPPASPRTDFTTSRPSPRVNFTTNDGLPRTDFTTPGRLQSMATYNSSPRTNTGRGHYVHDLSPTHGAPHGDSYPMLRNSEDRSSTDGSTSQANRYAGASSGLKISVTYIMIGVVIGVVVGVLLNHFKISAVASQWVSLPGDLFLRALKCLVVPYVFCSVAVAIGDIVFVGKVSVVGIQTAKIFAVFWITTSALGVAIALAFRGLFSKDAARKVTNGSSLVGLTCANNMTATMLANETIACVSASTIEGAAASFTLLDVNKVFTENTSSGLTELSLSDQIMGMITPFVSSNIISSMANGELLSIITFAMLIGSIAGRSYFTKTRRTNYLYLVLLQLRNAFFLAMEWTIWLTPIAVVSIIAGSFATNQAALRQSGHVYLFVVAVFVAIVLQILVLFPGIVFLMTKCNPYNHMRGMVRAYMFAFACSSSLATAPVTLTCVKKAKVCSQSLANFVISIGVTSNLSGVGIYIPIAVIFLAESSGNGDKITLLRIIAIYVLSLLSCAGTPPIPAAGLVTITTVYTTVFGVTTMPSTFAYVTAVDFLVDRITTVCNVNDDIMALKVIAENTDETVIQEQLGERF